jgi:cation transport ATPase
MKNDNFSDRLISVEQANPAFQERYEKEIKKMLEKTLTPIQRVSFAISGVMTAAMACLFAYLAIFGLTIKGPGSMLMLTRAILGLGTVFCVVWAVMVWKIVAKGAMNRRTHPNTLNGMVFVLQTFIATILLVGSGMHPNLVSSVYTAVFAVMVLLSGVGTLVTNRIEQSALKTEEKLLGIELRLAEIAEALPTKQQ